MVLQVASRCVPEEIEVAVIEIFTPLRDTMESIMMGALRLNIKRAMSSQPSSFLVMLKNARESLTSTRTLSILNHRS